MRNRFCVFEREQYLLSYISQTFSSVFRRKYDMVTQSRFRMIVRPVSFFFHFYKNNYFSEDKYYRCSKTTDYLFEQFTMDKNKQISATMRDTFERRRHQRCRVLELKVNRNRLNNNQLEHLNMLFVESKWCYNYLLDKMQNKSFDLFRFDPRLLEEITHKDKDGNDVTVNLSYITSSLKASLVTRLQSQIKTLRTLKKKGKMLVGCSSNLITMESYSSNTM